MKFVNDERHYLYKANIEFRLNRFRNTDTSGRNSSRISVYGFSWNTWTTNGQFQATADL